MSVNNQGNASGNSRRAMDFIVFGSVAALVLAFYFWTAIGAGGWSFATSKVPNECYNFETAGFRSGHLYLDLDPNPGLFRLADPYDPVQNAPYRAHDLSLYNRHYYMYYGVTPVFVLFWPFALITGRYVSEQAAVALFCTLAIWVCMALLWDIRRRYLPKAPFAALVLSWVCLGFATPLVLLVQSAQFYQVPIACALCMQALMLASIYASIHSKVRQLPWMAAAGLFFGLSVGARPNYILGGLVLLIPIWSYASRARTLGLGWLPALRKATLWSYAPAALCGAGLLYYNWARFGSATEFGVRYMLAGERFTYGNFYGWKFIPKNLGIYLFNFGLWQSYFPFFSAQARAPYGMLRYLPWCWLALAAAPWRRIGHLRQWAGFEVFSLAVGTAFVVNLMLLAGYTATFYRYSDDFANVLLLLACIGALSIANSSAATGRRLWVVSGMACLTVVSLFFSLTAYASWMQDQSILAGISKVANWPAFALSKASGEQFGAVRMEIKLPDQAQLLAEPLIETGRQPDQRDWVLLSYLPDNRARLSIFHAGTGLIVGKDFAIPADRTLVVEAQLGSLLPPFNHPAIADWTLDEYTAARAEVRLVVNGSEVLRTAADCYDSSPANNTFGRLLWFADGTATAFRGKILDVKRLPLVKPPDTTRLKADHPSPVELTLYLPAGLKSGSDPLLQTGKYGADDLLYCTYHGIGKISFGLSHYGSGGPDSDVVTYDPLVSHKVVVWMGSLATVAAGQPEGVGSNLNRLVVIFDGKAILNLDMGCYPGNTGPALIGLNAYASMPAGRQFSGIMERVDQVPFASLPKPEAGVYGAVDMDVIFPDWVPGTSDPLVVTGITGAGDFVYVTYLDGTHIQIGFDHWGIGGLRGEPMEINYDKTHHIAITLPSLYPRGTAAHESKEIKVAIDGKVALDGKYACHPSTSAEISIGRNLIGGSTCGDKFLGKVLGIERIPEPRP